MFQYSPPANIGDLSDQLKSLWSEEVHGWFVNAAERLAESQPSSEIRLFNLVDTPPGASETLADIQWNGFPRKYKLAVADVEERWSSVEQLKNADLTKRQAPYFKQLANGSFVRATDILFRDQDEYCEWHSFRGPSLVQVIIFLRA